MGLRPDGWSEQVVRLAIWLGGQVSFEQAAEIMSAVGQIDISASSIWRKTQAWGDQLLDHETEQCVRANALPSRAEPERGEVKHRQRMGLSVDGWLVNIRGEGWKEVKAGVIYDVERKEQVDQRSGETLEEVKAINGSYVAHLGGPEEFGPKLWTEAVRRRLPAAREKVWVSDGAHWIWGLCQDYFPQAKQIVDWYHAVAHLCRAGQLLYGEGTPQTKRWLERLKTELYQGHAARIAHTLEKLAEQRATDLATELRSEATFFRNHQRRMQYLEYRADGWPIGSGSVESTCKQFQARLKGPGMRWSRPGAERMLAIRAIILSRRFFDVCALLQNSPAA